MHRALTFWLVLALLTSLAAPAVAQDTPPDEPANPEQGADEPSDDKPADPKKDDGKKDGDDKGGDDKDDAGQDEPKQPAAPAKPGAYPANCRWPLFHHVGEHLPNGPDGAGAAVYEIKYYADGSLRARAQGRQTPARPFDDWTKVDDISGVNRAFAYLLADLRAEQARLGELIEAAAGQGAGKDDSGTAGTTPEQAKAARAALRAEPSLLAAHVAYRMSFDTVDQDRKRALQALALMIRKAEAERYQKTFESLRAHAQRFVAGELAGLDLQMMRRGPAVAPIRLHFLEVAGQRIALLHLRDDQVVTVRAREDGAAGFALRRYRHVNLVRMREPLLYLAWRGSREGLSQLRG